MASNPAEEPAPAPDRDGSTDRRPAVVLFRKRRQPASPADLESLLEEAGVHVLFCPLFEISLQPEVLKPHADRLAASDWLVVTSSHALDALFSQYDSAAVAAWPARWACVGSRCEHRLNEAGITSVLPRFDNASSLAAALHSRLTEDKARPQVTALLGDLAATQIDATLAQCSDYRRLNVYANKAAAPDEETAALIRNGHCSLLLFTSPSTVDNFVTAFDRPACPAAAIGQTTARAMQKYKINPVFTPDHPESDQFFRAIMNWLS